MAAIYARVSSESQDVDLSLSAQLKALREYAARQNYEVVREFVDEAESGRSASRPAFKEMIALAKLKQSPFDAILVWKLNRFSRSRADSVTYKTLLRKKGIQVISINEPIDESPIGQLIEGMIESVDEFYSANLGQDIKRGMRENASRGFFNGSRVPYGYRKIRISDGNKLRNKLKPEAEDSSAVRTVQGIFTMASRGMGCKEIAKALNKEGYRTAKGERWGRVTVHKILTNEAYCGTLVWGGRKGHRAAKRGDTPVRVENAWPALIDRNVFNMIQNNMTERSPKVAHPRTVPSTYIFSGLLFCSCGRAMIGHSAKSGRHFYYLCSRNYKQGKEACSARPIPKQLLERMVIDHIRQKILTESNMEKLVRLVNQEIIASYSGLREKIDCIDNEMRELKSKLSRHYEALETGKLDLDDLAPRIKELKTRMKELSQARLLADAELTAQSVSELDVATVKSYANDLSHLLDETDAVERKSFLKSFVKKIIVDQGQVTIYYALPILTDKKEQEQIGVLPIVTSGGAEDKT